MSLDLSLLNFNFNLHFGGFHECDTPAGLAWFMQVPCVRQKATIV